MDKDIFQKLLDVMSKLATEEVDDIIDELKNEFPDQSFIWIGDRIVLL